MVYFRGVCREKTCFVDPTILGEGQKNDVNSKGAICV